MFVSNNALAQPEPRITKIIDQYGIDLIQNPHRSLSGGREIFIHLEGLYTGPVVTNTTLEMIHPQQGIVFSELVGVTTSNINEPTSGVLHYTIPDLRYLINFLVALNTPTGIDVYIQLKDSAGETIYYECQHQVECSLKLVPSDIPQVLRTFPSAASPGKNICYEILDPRAEQTEDLTIDKVQIGNSTANPKAYLKQNKLRKS